MSGLRPVSGHLFAKRIARSNPHPSGTAPQSHSAPERVSNRRAALGHRLHELVRQRVVGLERVEVAHGALLVLDLASHMTNAILTVPGYVLFALHREGSYRKIIAAWGMGLLGLAIGTILLS